ncbi:hypothetical protein DSCA_12060 [Desulfosarcina alkanivorans]|uniref:Acetyltransferase n=1 Tax=Desulfosarcina alkanivorans TaxID=571177 RepID=A0A5K7YE38_9BACT|nr:acyltransferase [Desulfosarcina alkanivorans]BBO67276.1 hypothetical protein DSCA_12060 [Desulfosarcina alkanivorans]
MNIGSIIKKLTSFFLYCIRFYVSKLQLLIPHPKLRSWVFYMLGAKIGTKVRIEDISVANQAHWGFDKLEIGDYSVLTHEARLDLTGDIKIGKKTIIAGSIFTHQDSGSQLFESTTVSRFPRKVAPVIIGDNVYVAAAAIILCDVTIGDNAVVAAGSVVTNDVPADTLVAGAPAKIKKQLN